MKFERLCFWTILLIGAAIGLVAAGLDGWQAATHSERSGIERIIEIDREYFQSMQPVWDRYEAEHPEWERPVPTSEETYEQWRRQTRANGSR